MSKEFDEAFAYASMYGAGAGIATRDIATGLGFFLIMFIVCVCINLFGFYRRKKKYGRGELGRR